VPSLTGLINALDVLIAAATGGGSGPLVPFDPKSPRPAAVQAFERARHPNIAAQDQLRQRYVTTYGFKKGLREGHDKTIWHPWKGVTASDMEAVLTVANLFKVPPAHVLAIWLQEGKHLFDDILHGTASRTWESDNTVEVSVAQVRAWLRSMLFYQVFGLDIFTAFARVKKGDNALRGPQAAHNDAFNDSYENLKDVHPTGFSDVKSTALARTYFTFRAIRLLALTDRAGAPPPTSKKFPAGAGVVGRITLAPESVASLLYLQHAHFRKCQRDVENRLTGPGGRSIDLSARPWVAYFAYNGDLEEQYEKRFAGKGDPEAVINALFGNPPAAPLSAGDLARYSDGKTARSVLGNAIQLMYLIESINPWFA
jgi:hypothetical protein